MPESLTVNSIERIRQLVDTLKSEGIDPLSIYAALHQVAVDLEPEAMEHGKKHRTVAELAATIGSFAAGCGEIR